MAKTAIALIVAGSGEVNEQEVFDLLEDAYPIDDNEIGLYVPVDKDLYTDAAKFAVKWFDDDKNVVTIQTEGASLSRASAKLGSGNEKVSKFSEILNIREFGGDDPWDEVYFLVALPDPDDEDYDLYAEMVETAIDGGITVKNLAKALDDVVLEDPDAAADEPAVEEEPEPEPEVEEAKPSRRSRAKKTEPVEDEAVAEVVSKIEEKPEPVKAGPPKFSPEFQEALNVFGEIVRGLEAWDEAISVFNGDEVHYRPLTVKGRAAWDALAGAPVLAEDADPEPAEEAEDKPKSGRGRPRTRFEVKQIWDESEDEWVPRPMGRMKKGTKHRTIHAETNEVLEEGTA